MKMIGEIFGGPSNNFTGPRSSTAPSFGPVYAPNPPHSVARSGGGGGVLVGSPYPAGQTGGSVVGGSVVNGSSMNGMSRYPFDSWSMHPPQLFPVMSHHVFNNGEARRSFSTDSISPLLWSTQNAMAMRDSDQQPMPMPNMPQQGPSPPNSNNEQHGYPGLMTPWAFGGNIGQPNSSTPGSQPAGIHTHGHGAMPPAWFQQPPVSPFEVSWDGSPLPMRMATQWAGGYNS